MDEQTGHKEKDEQNDSLRTYLRDHTAGAEQAIQLFKALRDHHADNPLGHFAAAQSTEIEQDLQTLEDLARRAGANGFEVKELAGWLGDKLSRLKLTPLASPFSTFEALEFLSLGILGKRALWKTLTLVAPSHAELHGTDFALLIERAEAQYAATEEMRLQLAAQVFAREA